MPLKLSPSTKQPKSQQAAVNALVARSGRPDFWRRYLPLVYEAAGRWRWNPVFLLATLIWEGGYSNKPNSAGATGLAQLVDKRVGNFGPGYQSFLTQYGDRYKGGKDQATDPVWAINYMAYRMAAAYSKYGNLNAAYSNGYNPGFRGDSRGAGPASLVPQWYFSQAHIPASPTDLAGKTADVKQASQPFLMGETFLHYWKTRINPIFEAYTGREASQSQAFRVMQSGWSDYHLQIVLSGPNSPERKGLGHLGAFVGSPVWKEQAPSYRAVFSSIYGAEEPPPNDLIRYAIVHNLGSTGFQQKLREGPGYVKSEEFKQNVSSMKNVYLQIFGEPDPHGQNVIEQATLAGWSSDQFADYLRGQPEYAYSNEMKAKFADLAQTFGGYQTTTNTQTPSPVGVGAPTDPRLPRK